MNGIVAVPIMAIMTLIVINPTMMGPVPGAPVTRLGWLGQRFS